MWVCTVVTLANLWCGPVLRKQMLCHMSSLLDSMKGARQTPLHPATTYGVQRVPHRAGGSCGQTHTAVASIWPPQTWTVTSSR